MIKMLAGQIKEYKTPSILTPLFMLLEVAMEMLIPLMMASIIDDGVTKGNVEHIYKVGAVMIVCALIGLFAGLMGGKYGALASAGFAKNLRKAMFAKIQDFSFANIDKFSTAGLVTRMTTDVTNLQNAYQMILRMCMRSPASLICAMIMAFLISPRLASVYLVAVIFLAICLSFIIRFTMRYFRQVFQKYDDLNASVQENVSAIRVVKAYVRQQHEEEKFVSASGRLYHMFLKAEKILTLNGPLMQTAVYTCILLISWLGARMIVSDELTTGQLMSLLAYCMNILMSLMMLSMIFVMITMSSASAERITEVLKEESTLHNPETPDYEVKDGSITFEHVYFAYHQSEEEENDSVKTETLSEMKKYNSGTSDDKYVLKDVNLRIASGETIGIIGGTGSSKTTLVNLISRLYDVDKGRVLVGGKDVRSYDLETLRNEVSVVLQKNVLFSGTILENLRWGKKDASLEECVRACKLACADEFIERMPEKYETFLEQGGSNVSGGQKQRLCIARALLKSPKILILDDSTSAVDTATDAKIRKAFAEEIPDTTKIIIAQRISSIEHADRIIVLNDGVITGFGSHEELLADNEIYRDVYESQTNGNGDFDENGKEGGDPA